MPTIIDHPGIPGAKQVILLPSEPRPGGSIQVTVALDKTKVRGTVANPSTINVTVITSRAVTSVVPTLSPTDAEITIGAVTGSGTSWAFTLTVAKTSTTEDSRSVIVSVTAADTTTGTGAAVFTVDNAKPSAPTGVTAVGVSGGIQISWVGSTSPDTASYNVYYNTAASPSDGSVKTLAGAAFGTIFTQSGLAVGTQRWYWVTAVDGVGNESVVSSQVNATALGDIKLNLSLVKLRVGGVETFQASLSADQAINSTWLLISVSPADTDVTFGTVSPTGAGTNYTFNVIVNKATVGTFTRSVVVQIDTSLSGGKSGVSSAAFVIDTQAPAAATSLVVTPRIQSARVTWTPPADNDIAYYLVYRAFTNSIPGTYYDKTLDQSFLDSAMDSNTLYYYWVKAVDTVGNIGAVSASANGTTLQIITTDIALNAVSLAKFASGLQPVQVVASLGSISSPTQGMTALLTTDNKLYRYTGSAWTVAVPTADLTGTISNAQLGGGIDITKFASGLQPIQVVASLGSISSPTQGMTALLTTDNKLYRYTGSAWTVAVPTTDLTGTVTAAQLAGGIDITKFASGISPIQVVSSLPATAALGNVVLLTTDSKLYRWDGAAWTKAADGADITANSIDVGILKAGVVRASELAAGAVTANKLFVGSAGRALNDDPGCADQTAWTNHATVSSAVVATVTTITDGKIGNSVLRCTGVFVNESSRSMNARLIPYDVTRTYRISAWVRQSATGNGKLYLRVVEYAAAETIIGNAGVTTTVGLENVSPPSNVWTWYSAVFTPTAGKVNVVPEIILGYAQSAGYMEAQDVRIDEVIPGTLIQDGAITTTKIVAGTITADRLYAGGIDANKITAANIATDTITAGQIAAGAINTSELAAGAITASKLAVGFGGGAALNEDPAPSDLAAWGVTAGMSIAALTDGKASPTSLRSGVGVASISTSVRSIPIDRNKQYRIRAWGRRNTASNGVLYIGAAVYDATGANISKTGGGTYWYVAASGATPTVNTWTEYSGVMGTPGTFFDWVTGIGAQVPTTMTVLLLLNWGGTAGYYEVQDIRIEEVLPGTLIADGAITTSKMTANSIDADRILAGTIKAGKIYAGVTQSDLIQANNISTGAITATKLAVVNAAVDPGHFTDNSPAGGRVAWSGVTVVAGGVVYNPASGSTPDTQNYYIWLKASLGASGALQTTVRSSGSFIGTTTPSTAGNTFTPKSDVLLGYTVSGVFNQVMDGTVVIGDQIQTGTILAGHISTTTLAAIQADLGTITAGIITDSTNKKGLRLSTGYSIPSGWTGDDGAFIDLASSYGGSQRFMHVGQSINIDWNSASTVAATFKGIFNVDSLTGFSGIFTQQVTAGGFASTNMVLQGSGTTSTGFLDPKKARLVYNSNDSFVVYADSLQSIASSGVTNTTTVLNDQWQLWGINQFATGLSVLTIVTNGSGNVGNNGLSRTIVSNTSSSLTVDSAFPFAIGPDCTYQINNVRNLDVSNYLTTLAGTGNSQTRVDTTWTSSSNSVSLSAAGNIVPALNNAGPSSGDTVTDGGAVSGTGDYTVSWTQVLDSTAASITTGWTSITGKVHVYYRTAANTTALTTATWLDTNLEQTQSDAFNNTSGHIWTVPMSVTFRVPSNPSNVEFKLVPGLSLGWTGGTFSGSVQTSIVTGTPKVTWASYTAGSGTAVTRRNPRLFANSSSSGTLASRVFSPHLTMEPLETAPNTNEGRKGDIVFAAGNLMVHDGSGWSSIGTTSSTSYVIRTGDTMTGALTVPGITVTSAYINISAGYGLRAPSGLFFGEVGGYWSNYSNTTASGAIQFRNSSGTVKGYTYWDAGGIGLLNDTGNWSVRCTQGSSNAGGTLYGTWNITTGSLLLQQDASYQANLVFGASGVWDSGIRTYDNGTAEMRIWHMNAGGKIYLATGYNGNNATTLPSNYILISGGGNLTVTGGLVVGASGTATGAGDIRARRAATTGVVYFGDSNSTYLYYDGANFNFSGGNVTFFHSITIGQAAGEGQVGGYTGLWQVRDSYMGYSSSYKVVILGDLNGSSRSISMGVDLTGNTSGSFNGGGVEVFWKNAINWVMPNVANNSYLSMISWDANANATFGGSIIGNVTGNITGSAGSVPWSGITSKPTTLAGFGITDAIAILGNSQTFTNTNTFSNYTTFNSASNFTAGLYNDNAGIRVSMPGGGAYATSTATVTGAIKIRLPILNLSSNHMLRFAVKIYNYSTGTSTSFEVGGYNYSGPYWVNVFATQLTDTGPQYNVRFGRDSGGNCVWIGETSTVWSYPQVFITDFQAGYTATTNNWATGWIVSFVTTFDTVDINRASALVMNVNNIGSYAPSLTGGGASGTWAISITGNAATAGSVTNGVTTNGGQVFTSGPYSSDWFRSSGQAGWYNSSYTVGIYATATGIVRTYNGAKFITESTATDSLKSLGGITATNDVWINQANYGYGLVGVYASTIIQAVFAMDNAYRLGAGGTLAANFYGIGWSYDASGGGVNTGYNCYHGIGVFGANILRSYVGYNIWTAGSIYALGNLNAAGTITENSVPVAKVVLTTAAISTGDAAPGSGEGTLRIRYV